MTDCIFCQIAQGQIKRKLHYQDAEIVAFDDLKPLAPVHILIIPVKHLPAVSAAAATDAPLFGKMLMVAKKLASERGLDQKGYQLFFRVGKGGGQEVSHVHLHLVQGQHC